MQVASLFAVFGLRPDKSWGQATKLIGGLRRAMLGLAAATGAAKLVGWIEDAAHAGTEIISLSKQLGVSTRLIQEYNYVAKQSGSNTKEFVTAISQLERNLRLFAEGKGSKEVRRTFTELGLTQAQVAKDMKAPDGLNDVIFKISDRVKALGNTMDTATAIRNVAGRRARGFAADLANGSPGLRKMIGEAHSLGQVLSDEKLGNLKALDNNINKLKGSFSALFTNVIGTMAPVLIDMLTSALKWFQENREEIAGALTVAVKVLAGAFKVLATAVSAVFGLFKDAFAGDTGAQAILITVAGLIVSIVIPALYAMAVAAWASLGPYALIAAAIGLVVYAVLQLAKHWDAVKKKFTDGWHEIVQSANDFEAWLESLPGKALDAVEEAGRWIMKKLGDAMDWVLDKANAVWSKMKGIPIIGKVFQGIDYLAHGGTGEQNATTAKPAARYPQGFATTAATTSSTSNSRVVNNTFNNEFTVHGVKDAASLAPKLGTMLSDQLRHTVAGTAGEVQ